MINLPLNSGKEEYLISQGIPFEMTTTNNTKIIKSQGQTFMETSTKLKLSDLGFIQKVKRHADKLNISFTETVKVVNEYGETIDFKIKNFTNDHVIYKETKLSEQPQVIDNVVEIDVNSAYWNIAYINGIISHELFTEGLKKDKLVRLISLGALATVKKYWVFTGTGEPELIDTKTNYKTRSYFFFVSFHAGLIVSEILNSTQSYFSHVDAIFMHPDGLDTAHKILKSHGLKGKVIPTISLEVVNNPLRYIVKNFKEEKVYHQKENKKETKTLSLYEQFILKKKISKK